MCIQLETNEYRSRFGAHWPFLSGTGRTIQKDLGIAEYTDPLHITTPEIKAAWQQGRKELFYPCGKTCVQTLGEQD